MAKMNWVTCEKDEDIRDILFRIHAPTGNLPLEFYIKIGKKRIVKVQLTEEDWMPYLLEKGFKEITNAKN